MLPMTCKDLGSKTCDGHVRKSVQSVFRHIFADKNSRNLFFFFLINFSFALVELFYGALTNSLGLISDAFHMFFDCAGLVAGVVATVVTRWKANDKFSYGYVRAEVLCGFVNGILLLFVAFLILSEAVERAIEPPEVKHERLFIVSVLGFVVNLVGIYVFQHGHSHAHGSSHAHNSHSHDEGGGGSHIMKGVFLHVLADTLGSVGVIVSSILMQTFGWMIADPICSMFIAVLICISVMPLVRDSLFILMQRQPVALDNVLPQLYNKVMQLGGVYSVQEPHFWTLCTDVYVGTIKLEVSKTADPRYIVSHTHLIFNEAGVRQLYVQLDIAPM